MTGMNVEQARFNMIEQQVRPWEVLDPRVLEIMKDVPREAFVPAEYRDLAFADTQIPLAQGQCMMAPTVEGRMLQALNVKREDKVLEIGTGSGFITACLARLGHEVTSIEIHDDLVQSAAETLEAQSIHNVNLQTGDAFGSGIPQGPFDAIAVTGSLPMMDDSLQQRLAPGGRLFVIVGEAPIMEALLITRAGDQQWTTESLFETAIPALIHAPRPQRFSF